MQKAMRTTWRRFRFPAELFLIILFMSDSMRISIERTGTVYPVLVAAACSTTLIALLLALASCAGLHVWPNHL